MTKTIVFSAALLVMGAPAFAQTTIHTNDFDGRRVAWQTHGLWGVDETPGSAPGGHAFSGTKSLNFNNGTDYAGVSRGAAASPVIPVPQGANVRVRFECNYQTETTGARWDTRSVVLKIDSTVVSTSVLSGGRNAPSAQRCSAMGTWHTHEFTVSVPSSSQGNLQVEFVFNSGDDYANNFAGWFVDDFAVISDAAGPQVFNFVSRKTQNFQQYSKTLRVNADRTAVVYQSSPTARYAPINGRVTDAEFDALTQAVAAGNLASVPGNIPDPLIYIVAPTTFSLEVDSPVSTSHATIGGSVGVYGQWAALVAPVMDVLQGIEARLLSATQPTGDDHGDTLLSATNLGLGATVPATAGAIDPAGDVDTFRVAELVPMIAIFPPPQSTYTFETTVVGTMDTLIELYDTNGTLLVSDDDGGAGLASRASYTFTRGSPIWCKVRHYSSSGTGSYTIRATATPITTPVPGPGSDDHSDTTQNATTLSVNAAAEAGSIGTGGDVDVFQLMQIVPAIFPPPTFTYVFETTVVGGMDTVIELLAADGTVLATNDDSPGMGYASKIVYTGQAGSAQYVRVRHYSSTGTGDYTVKASTQ